MDARGHEMAAEHETASQAATWAVPILMLFATVGGLIEWARREIKGIRERWDAKALALDGRINELASGHIHDHDAWKLEVDKKIAAVEDGLTEQIESTSAELLTELKAHAAHDLEAINIVHSRLDAVHRDMATQSQVERVGNTTDQILLLLAGKEQRKG